MDDSPLTLIVSAPRHLILEVLDECRGIDPVGFVLPDVNQEPPQVAKNRTAATEEFYYSFDDPTVALLYDLMQTVPRLKSMFNPDDDINAFGDDLDDLMEMFTTDPAAYAKRINICNPEFVAMFEVYNAFNRIEMTAEVLYQVKLFEVIMYKLFMGMEWPPLPSTKPN